MAIGSRRSDEVRLMRIVPCLRLEATLIKVAHESSDPDLDVSWAEVKAHKSIGMALSFSRIERDERGMFFWWCGKRCRIMDL